MIGTTISRYEIIEKLGEGGMGVVYKAQDTKLERPVALKFLAAHLVSNEEAKKRFIREAKAAAALDHPNICTLYEIDEAGGRTFMAMAYLEGRTLEQKGSVKVRCGSKTPSTSARKSRRACRRRTARASITATSSRPTCSWLTRAPKSAW